MTRRKQFRARLGTARTIPPCARAPGCVCEDGMFLELLFGRPNNFCGPHSIYMSTDGEKSVIRRSYVIYGTLKRIAGYGLNAAQMQLTAGRHLIMELKAAGWIGIKQMIWGAGQHILDKETRCALVRFIDIMEQRHHIE